MFDSIKINQRGSTLLEVILALSLAAILLTLTAPSLRATGRLLELAGKQERIFERSTVVQDSVINAISLAYALTGVELASISNVSSESFSALPREHQPAKESTILTVVEIDPRSTFSTTGVNSDSLIGCLHSSVATDEERTLWLGVALTGSTTFRGKLTQVTGVPCETRISPTPHGKMLHPEFDADRAFHALVAYPIRDAYALFRDQQDNFRRVSLLTVESQPVTYGVSEFVIKEDPHSMQMAITLDGTNTFVSTLPVIPHTAGHYLDLTL